MAISNFLSAIRAQVSGRTKMYSDPTTDDFKSALQRWSDFDLKTPGAIVLAGTTDDIVETVKLALKYNIPFVPKAGGHSSWSTIGGEGIIIDLSDYNKISVDKSSKTVRVQSGVLNKALIEALYDHGLCVPLGGGNTIGTVPQALGGGICALSKVCGNTSDNIVSAKLVTATGELITVDSSSSPDLLWALKGAGQFFGLVTELELQTYPLSVLGTDDGTIWTGKFIFDISLTSQVAKTAESLMNLPDDIQKNTACLCVLVTSPQSGAPCLLLFLTYFGPAADADTYFAPFKALNPLMASGGMVKYTDVNNDFDPFCTKGGFKRFTLAGLPRFDPSPWQKIADIYKELVEVCPDAKFGGYAFEWATGSADAKLVEVDSVWAHGKLKCWVESLVWYTKPQSAAQVDKSEREALALATASLEKQEVHMYQNFSRDSSLQSRFGGKDNVEKLQALKKIWDPNGVFTTQLL